MRTLTITLVTAFVFLFSQQLTVAHADGDRKERGASQAVIAGAIKCFFDNPEFRHVALETFGGLGIIAIPIPEQFGSFGFSSGPLAEECSELIPSLAEQVPHRVCEVGSPFEPGPGIELPFVCAGRADAVISAVGKMAKAVNRLGQP